MKGSILSSLFQKVLLIALLCGAVSSCKDDDDDTGPSNNSVVELPSNVIGTFNGDLSYTNNTSSPVLTNTGTATLTRTGNKTYSISFSNGVPAINNLKFQTAVSGSYSTVSSDGSTAGMTLSSTTLAVGVTKGNETWAFTGDK